MTPAGGFGSQIVTNGRRLRPLPQRDPAQRRAVDWWVRFAPGILALHVIVLVVLRVRPGHLGLWLWYVGPIALAAGTAFLLFWSLRSAYRWKHGVNQWQVLAYLALMVVIFTLPVYEAYPSSYDAEPSLVKFQLPLNGPATVAWGGPTGRVNYHVFLPDQRWAYDLLVTHDGVSFRTDGLEVEDYHAYGLPLYSPASGTVFAAHDGEVDVAIDGWRWGLAGLGNHIGIEVAPEQYLFVGHMQLGSVAVGVNDQVVAGQPLGRIGNSGNSSEPHVHLHLQDTMRPYFGEGIPFDFHQYQFAGRIIQRGMPEGGRHGGLYVGDRIMSVATSSSANDQAE